MPPPVRPGRARRRAAGRRRKGPSKERRADPIVGMGLLLDARCVPMGLEIYPGNESERPRIREVIGALKERHHMTGRTVRVADKGPDCADNVVDAEYTEVKDDKK